jgi:hypothetical protein
LDYKDGTKINLAGAGKEEDIYRRRFSLRGREVYGVYPEDL